MDPRKRAGIVDPMKQTDLILLVAAYVLLTPRAAAAAPPPYYPPPAPGGGGAPDVAGQVIRVGDRIWELIGPWVPQPGSRS